MADDRMYIVCPDCKGTFLLAKSFGFEWSTRNYSGKPMEESLDKFFADHAGCDNFGPVSKKFELLNEAQLNALDPSPSSLSAQ